MSAPQVLYKLRWQMPGGPEMSVLGVHAAVSQAQSALVAAGAETFALELLEAGQGRRRRTPVDEPVLGAEAERLRIQLRQGER